jgi:hypothetical protein
MRFAPLMNHSTTGPERCDRRVGRPIAPAIVCPWRSASAGARGTGLPRRCSGSRRPRSRWRCCFWSRPSSGPAPRSDARRRCCDSPSVRTKPAVYGLPLRLCRPAPRSRVKPLMRPSGPTTPDAVLVRAQQPLHAATAFGPKDNPIPAAESAAGTGRDDCTFGGVLGPARPAGSGAHSA